MRCLKYERSCCEFSQHRTAGIHQFGHFHVMFEISVMQWRTISHLISVWHLLAKKKHVKSVFTALTFFLSVHWRAEYQLLSQILVSELCLCLVVLKWALLGLLLIYCFKDWQCWKTNFFRDPRPFSVMDSKGSQSGSKMIKLTFPDRQKSTNWDRLHLISAGGFLTCSFS